MKRDGSTTQIRGIDQSNRDINQSKEIDWPIKITCGGARAFRHLLVQLNPPPRVPIPPHVNVALKVFLGVYLLAPRTQTSHGRRSIAGRWEEGDVLEEDESDLTRMLRMEGGVFFSRIGSFKGLAGKWGSKILQAAVAAAAAAVAKYWSRYCPTPGELNICASKATGGRLSRRQIAQ